MINDICENVIVIFGFYYFFFYTPLRILSCLYLSKHFDNYVIYKTKFSPLIDVAVASIFVVLQYVGGPKILHVYEERLPRWLEMISFVIVGSEIGVWTCIGMLSFV